MSEGDVLRTQLAALRRLLKVTPVNTVAMRRRLADATVAQGWVSAIYGIVKVVLVRTIVVLLIAAAPMTSGGCTAAPPEDYPTKIAASRAQKDEFLNASPRHHPARKIARSFSRCRISRSTKATRCRHN